MFILTGLLVALLLLGSFVGWGRLVACAIFGSSRGDWPFQAAWGVCVLTVFGGLLNVFGCVSATANAAILLPGLAMLLLPSPVDPATPRSRTDNAALACLFAVSLVTLILSLFPLLWEPQDDAVAYAAFPKKMLESGSLLEPFSFRRIVGFGGYQYLQTLAYPFLSHGALQLFDRGIVSVLVAAALTSYTRRRLDLSWPLASLAGIAFLAHPLLRINLAPASIFSLLALTFLETFQLTSGTHPLKRAALLALIAAGLLSLRANAVAIVGSLFLILVLAEQRISLRQKLKFLIQVALIAALLILPWCLVLHRSSGTFYFPFIKGNYNPVISMSVPLTAVSYLQLLWKSASYSGLHVLLLLTVAALAFRTIPRSVIAYGFAAFLTAVAMISAFNLGDTQALHRYYSPFTFPAFILLAAAWLAFLLRTPAWCRLDGFWKAAKQRLANPAAAIAIGLLVLAAATALFLKAAGGIDWKRERDWSTLSLQRSLEGRSSRTYLAMLKNADSYRAALAAIPKGARVLAEIDAPFLLDFRAHDICLIDDIGVVCPPPGLPIRGGPEDLVAYLKSQSIEYLLYVRPDLALRESMAGGYNRLWWDSMKDKIDPNVRLRGPNYWWFFSIVEEMSARYSHLYDSSEAVVLSLAGPPAPPKP